MACFSRSLTLLALLGYAWLASAAANGDLKLETVHAKNGKSYQGLVVEETPDEVRLEFVKRKAGRPSVAFFTSIPRAEIKKIDKLSAKEHDELAARLQAIDPIEEIAGQLKPAVFVGADRKDGLSYASDHFLLISNASDDIVRRAAVRLEQLYAAFNYYLPPEGRPEKPNTTTTILLVQSLAEYQAMLKSQGRVVFNPAYYDAGRNEIVAASDLQPLGKQFAELRRGHEALLEQLKKQEAELAKLPKGEVQKRARQQLQQSRQEIAQANNQNEELFHKATQQLFRTMAHEAFHAYLANFVFPPNDGEVPRWLNEGLAQIFEEAGLEGGGLRVGQVESARLDKAQAVVRNGELVSLPELLRSSPSQFVVAHGHDRRSADRYYLTSWALSHYLMFEKRVVSTPALKVYLTALNGKSDPGTGTRIRGADPVEAMAKLAGQTMPELEKSLQQYLLKLQTDGTTRK
jgi:hypothetical protein